MKLKLLLRKISLLQLTVALSLLIIASSVAYYLVVFLPSKERVRQEQVKMEQEAKRKEQQIYQDCDTEAKEKARELLKSKIEIAQKTGTSIPATWKEASEKDLMLKDDYNSLYDSCLRRHGLKY